MTTSPQKSERIFDVDVKIHEPAAEPPIVAPTHYTPNVQVTNLNE